MNRQRVWIGVLSGVAATVAAVAGTAWGPCHTSAARAATPAKGTGVAVVELFTSEGCSSCPPADRVLSKLVADARADGTRVYPLAFHVDYWNRGGWSDRFSTAAYTARQRRYAGALRLDQVYTPQAVVNGTAEFVGSDAGRMAAAVRAGLAVPAAVAVRVAPTVDGLTVHAAVDVGGGGGRLNVAVVERGLSTAVRGGENGGRLLRHDNVVRGFAAADVPAGGGRRVVNVPLPVDVRLKQASVVAFVQDPATGAVTGADGADLPVP